MSWLCCGTGVSNKNTIEAGQQALARHRWDQSKKQFDRAIKQDPQAHLAIVDICERAIEKAALKHDALGDRPPPLQVEETPEVEPDERALLAAQKAQDARHKAHTAERHASLAQLHRLHHLAKHYHKCAIAPAEGDPARVAGLCAHVGLHHRMLSNTTPSGFNAKHNQRAFDYYSRAIETYDQAGVAAPAPIQGRMGVVTDKLMYTTEHWYKRKQKKTLQDAGGLLLTDFVRLINIPASEGEREQNLLTLRLLLQRDLPVASRDFLLHEIMVPLGQMLLDPAAEAVHLRVPLLKVFEAIIIHQPWAKYEAGDALRQYITNPNIALTLQDVHALSGCLRGLTDGKSKEQGRYDILPDLDTLRLRMHDNDKALVQVLVLLDDVTRFGSSQHTPQACELVRTIGMESSADNVQYSALITLDHLASYKNRADSTTVALEGMAVLLGRMKNPALREYGIVRIAFHNAHPDRVDAANQALYTTLGLSKSEVDALLKRQTDIYKKISDIETTAPTVAL